jgi:hypothetical protein
MARPARIREELDGEKSLLARVGEADERGQERATHLAIDEGLPPEHLE